jgi:hypothetical protein
MKTKMTHAMRRELANAIRGRYVAAASKDKRRILEEFIAATGYHDKSAIRALNSPSKPKSRQTRRRPSLYDEAARGALIVLWEASDRICGKRLKALLMGWTAPRTASSVPRWSSFEAPSRREAVHGQVYHRYIGYHAHRA